MAIKTTVQSCECGGLGCHDIVVTWHDSYTESGDDGDHHVSGWLEAATIDGIDITPILGIDAKADLLKLAIEADKP